MSRLVDHCNAEGKGNPGLLTTGPCLPVGALGGMIGVGLRASGELLWGVLFRGKKMVSGMVRQRQI